MAEPSLGHKIEADYEKRLDARDGGKLSGDLLPTLARRSTLCMVGASMSAMPQRPALASYRDTVVELMEEGTPFGVVEDAINSHPGLTEDQKAALWLFAFSLRDRSTQKREAQAHLTAVTVAAHREMTGHARWPTLGDAVEAAVSVQAGAGRHLRYQRDAAGRNANATNYARPLEFDERGFPVPQRHRSFRERVARLLDPQ